MTDFRDRYGPWAIVAGASEGTGAAFSREIAARGVNVVLVARRPDRLNALAEQIHEASGVETRVVALDLSGLDASAELAAATADLDVGLLIYNAGADEYGMKFLDVEADRWAAMVHRNCVVPLRLCHHYARPMVDRGRGGILLVTSGAAWAGGEPARHVRRVEGVRPGARRRAVGGVVAEGCRRPLVRARTDGHAGIPRPRRQVRHDGRRDGGCRRRRSRRPRASRRRPDPHVRRPSAAGTRRSSAPCRAATRSRS